jgi:hypothetical protein
MDKMVFKVLAAEKLGGSGAEKQNSYLFQLVI